MQHTHKTANVHINDAPSRNTSCFSKDNLSWIKRVPTSYSVPTDSEDSKNAHQQCTIKNKDKPGSKKQLKLDKYVNSVSTEYKAVSDSEDSECDCPIRTYFTCHNSTRIPLHTPPQEHTPHCKSAYC